MSLNDLHPIRELRRRESRLFENVRPATNPKRVLFYSMDPWQLGVFEMFLHLAMQRRGHDPRTIYDDGLLPLSAWENAAVPPPAEGTIRRRFEFMHDCFGIPATGISAYLDAAEARPRARQIVAATRDEALSSLVYRGLSVGRIARRDLTQYSLGWFDPRTPADFAEYRRHLEHAVMSTDLAEAILDAQRPDIVVLVNGKSVMYSYMYEAARRRGTAVTTWEEGGYFDASVVLANDDRAIDFPVEEASWQAARRRPLTAEQAAAVAGYFRRWRRQEARYYTFYDRAECDIARIRQRLGIRPDARMIALFTNIVWDTNALEKDRAFDGMFDWICATIDWVRHRPDRVLVVRAHPGEVRLSFKTRTPIRSLIEGRYGRGLPDNVRIIDAESDISSYTLADHAEQSAVYTSTLGAELTLMGLRPLVCGTPFYSGRGLTCDVESRQVYFEVLDGRRPTPAPDVEGLKRFLHLIVFRLVKRPEFFHGIHGHPQQPRIAIDSFEKFPESMPVFNEIVDCILKRRSFVGPARAAAVDSRRELFVGAAG